MPRPPPFRTVAGKHDWQSGQGQNEKMDKSGLHFQLYLRACVLTLGVSRQVFWPQWGKGVGPPLPPWAESPGSGFHIIHNLPAPTARPKRCCQPEADAQYKAQSRQGRATVKLPLSSRRTPRSIEHPEAWPRPVPAPATSQPAKERSVPANAE